jgi:hypothetical protein
MRFSALFFPSLCSVLFAVLPAHAQMSDKEEFEFVRRQIHTSSQPLAKAGVVPDSTTAASIAYAVALPIYGKKMLDEELPLRTELRQGIWTVLGTLHCKSCVGGTLIVQIIAKTGEIKYLSHSK